MTDAAKPKVLLVDDSKTFQQIFHNLLEAIGCEVICCRGGQDAMQLAQAAPVDFVCSSLFLEDMEGVELARSLRKLQAFGSKPIVLLTSEKVENLASRALPAGITEIFLKNEIEELIAFIQRFVFQNQRLLGRILYLEDGDSQRVWLTHVLQDRGLQVDAHASIESAWPDFVANAYDLVITDIVLKNDQSGIGFINKIRRQIGSKGDVPILAVTAFDDLARRIELFTLGVNDYIVKPVITEELIARVNNLVRRRTAAD